jgi:FkbM family methyltransferase
VRFLSFLPSEGGLFGFEPQYETYLQSPHARVLEQARNVRIYPQALWKEDGTVWFQEKLHNRDGSRVIPAAESDAHARKVPAVTIDSFMREQKITKLDFLKLDIEGSEHEVLTGGRNTLSRDRPQLAVCIYHKKEDLFGIPLYLRDMLKDYVYRIGHYTCSFWDTVWYAIPKELYQS